MKRSIIMQLERAHKRLQDAANFIIVADDKAFYEETEMLTRNMSAQATIKELCKRTIELRNDLASTICAMKE